MRIGTTRGCRCIRPHKGSRCTHVYRQDVFDCSCTQRIRRPPGSTCSGRNHKHSLPWPHSAEQIEKYLDTILSTGKVDAKYTNTEGGVQAAISNSSTAAFGAFQREAVPSFQSKSFRDKIVGGFRHRIDEALQACAYKPKWWPGPIHTLGLEADLLGLDDSGRLLVMEVKPATAVHGISLAPAQVRLYAERFGLWLETNPDAREHIISMVNQRLTLILPAPHVKIPSQASMRVVPVISIGAGKMSAQAHPRLEAIHAALQAAPSLSARLDPLEIWRHDEAGA